MTEKEVQVYVDEKYPKLHLAVRTMQDRDGSFRITCVVNTECYLGANENISRIDDRLCKSLEAAKGLIEHDIIQIQGGTENEGVDRHQEL